jgi:hypothetical protein
LDKRSCREFVRILFFLSFFLWVVTAGAQDLSQQVRGRVEDKALHTSLVGASVKLIGASDSLLVASDTSGNFVFESVFPGRYELRITFTGYQSWQQEIVVISARSTEVIVSLEESPNVLESIEITSPGILTEVGSRSIGIEKTLRVPANFFDPVRVLTSFPGVVAASDQSNTIVVRGNSPAGLLWKINGLDVVNPNHLANAGTLSDLPVAYGGGVNIISSQLLDRTDLYAGSFPARFGNSLSGIVDMNLREGDKQESHVMLQASLIGLDVAAEGPIGKKKHTSFVANYRSSTVAILSALGAKFGDEDINFQDFTFSVDSKLRNNQRLSFFGFYGMSKNDFEHKDPDELEVEKDQYDINYDSKNFGTGVTFDKSTTGINISTGVAISGGDQRHQRSLSDPSAYTSEFESERLLVSAFGSIKANINSSLLESGVTVNYVHDAFPSLQGLGIDEKVSGILLQPYVQWKHALSDQLITQAAVRYLYYTYNQTGAFEPRLSFEYFSSARSSIKFSYNLISQSQQSGTYVFNENLELSKTHHLDLGYKISLLNGFRLSTNVYYQSLYDIPIQQFPSSYSLINSIESTGFPGLVSRGTGNNYGAEFLGEKSFFDKSYFILGGSAYKSTYRGSDLVERSTRFDGGYTVNLTYGKEWSKTKKESLKTFGISSRLLYLGGLRETPIELLSSGYGVIAVEDDTRAFENKLKDYFRCDLRLNWKKNKKGYTRTIAIDIQNVFNIQNEAYHYYDDIKGEITTQYQLGIIPILIYRIEF